MCPELSAHVGDALLGICLGSGDLHGLDVRSYTSSVANDGGFDLHLPLRLRRHFANGCCNSPSLYSGGYRMTCFPLVMY
jgi:hypothetical protein